MSRFQSRDGERLHWRVIVQSTGTLDPSRGARHMTWHLVECASPSSEDAHCPQGRLLLAAGGDPDGHCLVDAVCPRCGLPSTPEPPPQVPVGTHETE